ncbi:protein-L-isoaspartate(D-aspartate) O-methyltransferase [Vibrio breoganii]|uniref:Protein-L-isoaspartate O-methyltransferase n=2 Tax=Vibrio TaxID=662 RepID=A0AAJ5EI29_9VIBR|nr:MULTISPECIES: protein-L-isoaspartate(D-aspartate) O-methyltransferase [Vibrio]ANO33688.1 protein-L-isoaspartate O-methyltransferase [Vibrio breoganii]MDN3717186.1 protein-L-isoaspartate(D-aspartate) O-methyltransferase [Vibrio breoganii]NMO71854.1 protein-L-isoaspartate(D-aspartate) O-methyltransferase [Vibrio breoganii]NMR68392.1 protein-L-isoaspartate(D-aspartate) O-methyltransferase [Vibrio breoganii]OCH70760.1 protein-L-isoaspartate O-methyltransferase [Vibrio breoganii]
MGHYQAQRLSEHLQQLGIRDSAVLKAMANLPRESFLSEAMRHQAYDNNALPIGNGQTISQPYIVARMTELLELDYTSKVLEVGTGSGYQTAVLAQLVERVHTIERIKTLQWDAKRRLSKLDIYNVSSKYGDGWKGWGAHAPFDAIIVTAAAAELPQALVDQLAVGGRLIIPIGDSQQQLLKIVKHESGVQSEIIEDVRFVPLVQGELA